MAKFGIQVSMGQCRRAKKYALKLVEGSPVEHYGKLWSNGHEILRTNHGSTVKLDVEDGPDGKKYFSKFYCCFQGVKQGWIEGCRRIIVVNVENKQNWKWFLELLIDDLNLNLGNGFSLMSDQHKKDPKTWSRGFFQTGRCCDAVENRFSESFNVVIVDARKKPIITMLEELRLYMMDRIYNMKLKGKQWGNYICPKIRDKVNLLKKTQRHYQVLPSGLNQFEVRGATDAYKVDLERKTCSCRLWQLNGYGCAHYIASISFLNRDVEAYVDNIFSTTTFRKAYNYRIAPMNSGQRQTLLHHCLLLIEGCLVGQLLRGRNPLQRIQEHIGFLRLERKSDVGSTSEPQQYEEVEMTPIEMDTTQNDISAGDFSHYMQFNPSRSYEGDEGVVGEEADVVEEAIQDEEAEEVDLAIQVDNVNVQEVDVVNPNAHVDNVNVQEVAPVIQVQQANFRDFEEDKENKSERILKLELGKTIGGVDDPGNSKGKVVVID
uniref:SWIM-type domain-containing protein n=1 Tax=Lactuca sativa TaxID=4236 RepID=A0A9R1WTY4_LACSA|nr:hypothetical protein LSAT_V11C800415220 [Lactuca sativa]